MSLLYSTRYIICLLPISTRRRRDREQFQVSFNLFQKTKPILWRTLCSPVEARVAIISQVTPVVVPSVAIAIPRPVAPPLVRPARPVEKTSKNLEE